MNKDKKNKKPLASEQFNLTCARASWKLENLCPCPLIRIQVRRPSKRQLASSKPWHSPKHTLTASVPPQTHEIQISRGRQPDILAYSLMFLAPNGFGIHSSTTTRTTTNQNTLKMQVTKHKTNDEELPN